MSRIAYETLWVCQDRSAKNGWRAEGGAGCAAGLVAVASLPIATSIVGVVDALGPEGWAFKGEVGGFWCFQKPALLPG